MSARTERDLVSEIALHDSPRAHQRARAIAEPLYRAQALAWVARYAPDAEVVRIAREALMGAAAADDPYHRVAATAWPIRALVERDFVAEAERGVATALDCAALIENPVSRVDALFLVWQGAYPLGAAMRARITTPLLAAALSADSWKPQRTLLSLIFMLPPSDRASAEQIVDCMPAGKYKRGAARRLAAGERQEPRSFFRSHPA